jgi:hypothetical protein
LILFMKPALAMSSTWSYRPRWPVHGRGDPRSVLSRKPRMKYPANLNDYYLSRLLLLVYRTGAVTLPGEAVCDSEVSTEWGIN